MLAANIQTSAVFVSPDMRTTFLLVLLAMGVTAHPMGNFSVNHYSRLYFKSDGLELTYVLDLAEIPTFQLMGDWGID